MTVDARPTELDWGDLALSDEQREFAAVVREHLASRVPLSLVRETYDDASRWRQAWDEASGAGYPLVGLPERCDGIGAMLDAVVLLEEAGRAVLPAPLLATVMAYQTLIATADDVPERHLTGDVPMALAAKMVSGSLVGDTVRGFRAIALDAADAGACVAFVPGDRGPVAVLIDLTAADVRRRIAGSVDPSRPLVCLEARDAPLLWRSSGVVDPERLVARARLCIAADLVGVATAALTSARDHVLKRVQFGRAIAEFQAVKHRLADVYVSVERARSLVRAGALVAALPEPTGTGALELSLMAKAAAADAALRATLDNVQLFGAIGVTFEADSHLFLRRAHQEIPLHGSPMEIYAALGRSLAGGERR